MVLRARRQWGRKSQVALEYIHTYGWILLSVMVLGGVTLYHNISNTDYLVPKECIFLSGIDCLDFVVDGNLLEVVLVNEFGFALGNVSLQVIGTCNSTANTTDGNPYGNPNVLVENQHATFVFECQNLTNMRLSEKLTVGYLNVESGTQHTKVGSIEYVPGD